MTHRMQHPAAIERRPRMTSTRQPWRIRLALALLLLPTARPALAQCSYEGKQDLAVTWPATNFTLGRDLAVGGIIGKLTVAGPANSADTLLRCAPQDTIEQAFTALPLWGPGNSQLFPTNLPGIAYKIEALWPAENASAAQAFDFVRREGGSAAAWSTHLGGLRFTVTFVKTAPGSAGGMLGGGQIGRISASGGGMNTTVMNLFLPSIVFQSTSCSTGNVTVNLGTHASSAFKGMGSSTAARRFDIQLNRCPAGLNLVEYQLGAITPIVDASQAVVALDSHSTARGVGVQILDEAGKAVPLGMPIALAQYRPAAGGDYRIPLQARYYQTGSRVSAGSADSAIMFTMNYL